MSIRHDYKSAATGQSRQRARRYGLLVMTLVLIGLFGGLLAYIKGGQTQPAPATAAVAPSTPAQPPTTPAQPPAASPPLKTVALSVAEPEPVKPKYDFYTELPKRKIAIQRETVKPANASRPAPTRIQPAANPLQKPAAPRRNAASTSPTMATASGAKPDSKTTNSKTANSKTANSKTARFQDHELQDRQFQDRQYRIRQSQDRQFQDRQSPKPPIPRPPITNPPIPTRPPIPRPPIPRPPIPHPPHPHPPIPDPQPPSPRLRRLQRERRNHSGRSPTTTRRSSSRPSKRHNFPIIPEATVG